MSLTAPKSNTTESEIYISSFLSLNPDLGKALGAAEQKVEMTDRYTNEEWASQIAETQRRVLREMEERRKNGERGWKHQVDGRGPGSGDEGLRALAKMVDHTVLKLDVKDQGIDALCSEARIEGFKSVCVRLPWVPRCVSNLKGSDVVVACVVGFHEGTQDTYSKLHEARAAVAAGAAELDIVLNHSILTAHNPPSPISLSIPTGPRHKRDSTADTITAANTVANSRPTNGAAKPEGPYSVGTGSPPVSSAGGTEDEIPDYSAIYRELASLRSLCPSPTTLKLILETSQLTDDQIIAASHLAAAANIDFIKTSTGFNGPGATLPHVRLMVTAAEYLSTKLPSNAGSPVRGGGRKMEVKASGGVRCLADARKMLGAGATRLGTSSGLWIMQEGRTEVEAERNGGVNSEDRPGATRLYTDDSVGGY